MISHLHWNSLPETRQPIYHLRDRYGFHSYQRRTYSPAQNGIGDTIPQKPVKGEDPEHSITLDGQPRPLAGKNIIVRLMHVLFHCSCYGS